MAERKWSSRSASQSWEAFSRFWSRSIWAFRSSCRSRAASSSSSTTCSVLGVRVRPFQLLGERVDVAVADALLERLGQPAFEDLGEAAQLAFDDLGLPDQDFEDAILLAIGVDEVVAEDLVDWAGACGRCGRCAVRGGSGSRARRSGTGSSSGSGG